MKRSGKKNQGHQEGTGWTANSDLFMAVAIVFLIMFVFALLASGASQISLQKEKLEAQKHLLGKIPDSEKIKTQKQLELAAKDIKDLGENREFLKMSLVQLAQMAETMESREQSLKNLYETQNQNLVRIEQSQETIENQAKDLRNQKLYINIRENQLQHLTKAAGEKQEKITKFEDQLAELESQRSQLQSEREALSKDRENLKEQVAHLAKTSESLQSKNKNLDTRVQALSSELEAKQNEVEAVQKENKALSKAKQNNGQQLSATEQSNSKLENELKALRSENQDLKAKNGGYQKQLQAAQGAAEQSEGRLKVAEGKNGSLQAANAKLGSALKAGQAESDGLKGKLGELNGKLAGLQGELDKMSGAAGKSQEDAEQKGQELGAKSKELAELKEKHKRATEALADNEKKNKKLEERLAAALADNEEINKEAADINQRLAQVSDSEKKLKDNLANTETARKDCETEKEKQQGKQKKFALAAKSQKDKLDAVAGTLDNARKAVQEIDNERKRIATGIANNLKASGVEVDINPETGNITLRMDESFYFKNASYQLRDEAKLKLSQIVPIYAKSLLENPKIAQRIESILVTGYASPKFKKAYVDPQSVTGEAYDYNMELSVNRAREIVAYMFGNEISNFPLKEKMRNLVSVSGVGMMKAIPTDADSVCNKDPQALAKFEECSCGPYDCKRSRRVELQFVLKNQKDTDRQLQKISDKLIEKEILDDAP